MKILRNLILKLSFAIILIGSLVWGNGQTLASLSQNNGKENRLPDEVNVVKKQTAEEKKHGREIDEKLSLVAPFVKLDEGKLVSIDKEAAKEANVPSEAIKLGEKLYKEQNRIITEISKNGKTFDEVAISSEVLKEFNDYFHFIAEGRNTSPSADPSIIDPKLLSVQPEASGGCGGDTNNPHPCPDRQQLYWYYSLTDLQQKFYSQGYHATADYAGGAASWNPARDFTKCVSAYNCVSCAFRYQGVIVDSSIANQYHGIVQVPEPNPEVFDYSWPTMDWGTYVKWWHENYC